MPGIPRALAGGGCQKVYKTMNWYKESQFVFAYHGTDAELLPEIKRRGLVPIEGKIFFAMNENDISPYADGLWLRFPVPFSYQKHIGRGDYYSTQDSIPPGVIEFKTDQYEDYRPIAQERIDSSQEKMAQTYFDIMNKKNILWFIDTNYRLHIIEEDDLARRVGQSASVTHDNWPEFQNTPSIAHGRYDGNEAFVIMSPKRQELHYYEFIENKVKDIISRSFNNPKMEIYW
ncbi:MAG: hypothetical protein ACOC6D_08405 [Atribacterota bacterium]